MENTNENITATATDEMIVGLIAKKLGLRERQVAGTVNLLKGGATIPFISRYRKETTGGLNEVQIAEINDSCEKLEELVHRREYILNTIEEQGKLTPELRQRIAGCWDADQLEDLYLPYKPKRKTRAEAARKKGLQPLADSLLKRPYDNPERTARQFLNDEVPDVEAALSGARDIIAEHVNEDEQARQSVRRSYQLTAVVRSKVVKGKEEEGAKFRDYFDWQEPLRRCSSHRMLAMLRGEAEGFLKVSILPADDDDCRSRVARRFVRPGSAAAQQLELAVADAYKRLRRPSF